MLDQSSPALLRRLLAQPVGLHLMKLRFNIEDGSLPARPCALGHSALKATPRSRIKFVGTLVPISIACLVAAE